MDDITLKIKSLKSQEIESLTVFQDVVSFLAMLKDSMAEKGNTSHEYYKIAKKLEVDVRAIQHHHAECLSKLAYYVNEFESNNTL